MQRETIATAAAFTVALCVTTFLTVASYMGMYLLTHPDPLPVEALDQPEKPKLLLTPAQPELRLVKAA